MINQVIPISIISGFLGVGKTSLLSYILTAEHGKKIAVLVNDFGDLAIDARLIESSVGNVINLSGGCVCCSYGSDLTSALLQLDSLAIDQVVIEASGVALPGAIASSLSLLAGFSVNSIIVLVDGATIESQSTDKYLADTIERQLAAADIMVINKIDLLTDNAHENLKKRLQRSYPSARVLSNSKLDGSIASLLIDCRRGSGAGIPTIEREERHDIDIYKTLTLSLGSVPDLKQLAVTLASEESGLLRVKGFVKSIDGEMHVIQIVGQRWSIDHAPPGASEGLVCIGITDDCSESSVKLALTAIGVTLNG